MWHHLTQRARGSGHFDNLTNVKDVMDTWTLQTGYPEVNVTRNYGTQEVEFSQKRFVYISGNKNKKRNAIVEKPQEKPLWWIPLSYTTSRKLDFNATQPATWMRKTEKLSVSSIDIEPDEWLLVNIQQTGKLTDQFKIK